MNSEISSYQSLVKLRDQLKRVQQLSWNITQFERKFPFEASMDNGERALLEAYMEFMKEMEAISSTFVKLMEKTGLEEFISKSETEQI